MKAENTEIRAKLKSLEMMVAKLGDGHGQAGMIFDTVFGTASQVVAATIAHTHIWIL